MTDSHVPPTARWLRWSVAFVWLATGVAVLHPYYREVGGAALDALGLPHWLMWATCAGEVGLGLWLLLRPMSTTLAALQVGAVLTFTAILASLDPMLLAHPMGVLSKNLPFVVAVGVVVLLQKEGWSARAEQTLRLGMAVVWLTEGIVPKILFQQEMELAIVRDSGLVPMDPSAFLVAMGAAQALSGVLAVVAFRTRSAAARSLGRVVLAAQTMALVVLPLLVAWQLPLLWVHPYGPLTKNVPIVVGTAVLLLRSAPPAAGARAAAS